MGRPTAVALLVLGLASPATPRAAATLEYEVKAAFLLNFTRFIEWPAADASEPFRLCVFRTDPFGDALPATLDGETSHGRRLIPALVTSSSDARQCHVVFVPRSEADRAEDVLQTLHGEAVLTVGESSGFLQHGGIINFVTERDRIRFDISTTAADASNLRVSSRLLRLARHVVRDEKGRR